MSATVIKTDRLILRGPAPHDIDPMYAVYSDPHAMKYWSTPPHDARGVTQDLLDRRMAHWTIQKTNFQIEYDGQYIGNAGNFWKNEIGFMLAPQFWRHGFVSEAMRAIIPHLWAVTEYATLTADADPDNRASIGLLNMLGFQETHRARNTFCIDGNWVHSVYFALPRPA